MQERLRRLPWRPRSLWPYLCAVTVLAVLVLPGGHRESMTLSLGRLVPPAQATTVFKKNNCENSGCHGGLVAVEEIHPLFALRCVDCHGGDQSSPSKEGAHVPRPPGFGLTRDRLVFPLSADTHTTDAAPKELRGIPVYRSKLSVAGDDPANNDHRDPALLAYRRFRNPGDLLVADQACGECHGEIVERVRRSLHATMAGFMSGVFYANGHPGASEGRPQDFVGTDADKLAKLAIVLPRGEPLVDPHFDPTIPGTVPTIAREVPRNDEERRTAKKSDSLGMITFYVQTDCSRCHLYTAGSKAPGDYRSTGCTACHVVYRSEGFSETFDDMIPKNEPGHPFKHLMTRFAPVEQCAHCHNRGARHTQRFLGFRERPQGDRGLPEFRILNEHGENLFRQDDSGVIGGRRGGFYPGPTNLDPATKNIDPTFKFGGLFFKPGDILFEGRPYDPGRFDRGQGIMGQGIVKGFNTLSLWRRNIGPGANPFFIRDEDRSNSFDETPPDVHGERGMTCVDCHTKREMHGDGHLYTDRFHKVEIQCESCHGSAFAVTSLTTRFGNPVKGLSRNPNGSVALRLNSSGETRRVPQIKEVMDSGRNPNTQGPSHLLHGRLECYTCHAVWHDQCNSCHMITDYTSTDTSSDRPELASGFFSRSYMDNETRNADQGQPRFVTTFDQLILGINAKGRIQNFHTGGQATVFANKVAGGGGGENNLSEGNFLEFSRCAGGSNDRGLCENNSDCPGGTCPKLTCFGGPFDGRVAEQITANGAKGAAEGACKQCAAGLGGPREREGQSCSVDCDCKAGGCQRNLSTSSAPGTCVGGSLSRTDATSPGVPRVCFGGPNDGQPCRFDPTKFHSSVDSKPCAEDPGTLTPSKPCPEPVIDNLDCPSGTCGVRMANFVFSTKDKGLHLPAMLMNPLFPHTVRKIPRNCDNCHLKPGFLDPNLVDRQNIEKVIKALGLGTGTTRVLDGTAPGGSRIINISRRVRIFANGKGDLSITNPETGLPVRDGEEVLLNIDEFANLTDFDFDGHTLKVRKIKQVRPTTHVGTGPLDATAMEKMINNVVTPQIPSQPGP